MDGKDAETRATFLGGDPRPSGKPKGGLTWLLTVCVCVCLIDLLLIGLVVVFEHRRHTQVPVCPDPDVFCLPCKALSLSAGEDKLNFRAFGYRRVDKALEGDCCAESPSRLRVLLQLFVKRKQRIRRLTELAKLPASNRQTSRVSPWKPAAHFVTQTQTEVRFSDEDKPGYLAWDFNGDNSSSFNQGFAIDGSRIVINESAHYYVYSQLMFEEVTNASSSPSAKVCHFLVRTAPRNASAEHRLLENSIKLLGDASKTHSSYLGAVFSLSRDDVLGIKVSGSGTRLNPAKHPHGNFFGLYKV